MTSGLAFLLDRFKGRQIIDCIDEIQKIAAGYTINVMDPSFNLGPIDSDTHRINVRTDGESRITSFTLG